MRGRNAAIAAEQNRRRMVAYEEARWIGFAFHDPKNPPEFKPLTGATTASEKEAAAAAAAKRALIDDARVRGYLIAMSTRRAPAKEVPD